MLLAYRRGLLKPDYPNGLQSRLREKVLLDSLDIELAAERMQTQIGLVHTVCAPHYGSEKLENVISRVNDKLDVLYRLKEYDVKYGARKSREEARSKFNLGQAFTALKERGIIKSFKNFVKKTLKKLNLDK